jgi:hypothetical protein
MAPLIFAIIFAAIAAASGHITVLSWQVTEELVPSGRDGLFLVARRQLRHRSSGGETPGFSTDQ